jgi:hypothetical protein
MPDRPIPKPKQFLKVLDILNTQGAANMIDPKSYADMVGQYAFKAYKNDELSYRDYLGIVKPLFGKAGEMVTKKIEERDKDLERYATGGRVKYSDGSDEPDISKLREKIIELMDTDNLTFEEAYREAREEGFAKGGRVGLQEGKLAQLGNIVDVKNIPYYASKATEGAVNAGEILSKLPFAAGNLVSKLMREKPNKEMFLSALNDIQPGSFSEAIGLSDVIARQEENLSPETKTAGSQLSLTSETFIPVGTAIKLGDKIVKTATKKLGKDGAKLEKQIDEKLTAYGEGRRDFNKMVATTGMFAALKALGITSLAGKTAAKTADFRVKMFGDMDVADNFTDLGNEPTAISSLSTYIQPLTEKGKKIMEKFVSQNKNKPKNQKANFEIDKDGEFVFSDGENALTAIEDIKKYSDNFELETPVRVSKKPGGEYSYDKEVTNKIFKPGENYADDVIMENYSLSYAPSYGPLEYVDEFAEDIINTVLPKRVNKSSGGRMKYGDGTKPMTKSEKWMRDYFFSGKGGYDDRMSYQEFAIGPGQELFKRFSKKNGGTVYGKYAKQIISS